LTEVINDVIECVHQSGATPTQGGNTERHVGVHGSHPSGQSVPLDCALSLAASEVRLELWRSRIDWGPAGKRSTA